MKGVNTSNGWYYVYSYETIMAIVLPSDRVILNIKYYSRTTSKIQHLLKNVYEGYEFVEVEPKSSNSYFENTEMERKADDVALLDY